MRASHILTSAVVLFAGVATTPAAETPATSYASIGGQEAPRAARSVHLQWNAAESAAFYLEMAVEHTTPGSYFMACGWSGG